MYVHLHPSNARTQRQQRVHAAILGPRAPESPAIREEEWAAGVQAAAAVAAACRSGSWGGSVSYSNIYEIDVPRPSPTVGEGVRHLEPDPGKGRGQPLHDQGPDGGGGRVRDEEIERGAGGAEAGVRRAKQ